MVIASSLLINGPTIAALIRGLIHAVDVTEGPTDAPAVQVHRGRSSGHEGAEVLGRSVALGPHAYRGHHRPAALAVGHAPEARCLLGAKMWVAKDVRAASRRAST